ncbi:EPIDERMAL PATTERNING FACTOR-like protein 9 [Hordeum vulgare]|nr:EPIDERMAL PATTERNING FACTOR-like protein 9 [Hordeum vulgare]
MSTASQCIFFKEKREEKKKHTNNMTKRTPQIPSFRELLSATAAARNRQTARDYGEQYAHQGLTEEHMDLQENIKGLNKEKPPKYARRMLIGSIAPICTYNECRGCRSKCTAEQVPVDANDPMNSAYHYKCVCHR